MIDTSRITLSIAADPVDSRWQLPAVSEGRAWLLAWRVDPWPVDAGLPPPLALVLAEALCACGAVAYLSPVMPDLAQQQGWVRVAGDPPHWHHTVRPPLLGRLVGGQPAMALTATTDAKTAAAAFDIAGFDWSQQGQIVMVLSGDEPPPVDLSALGATLAGAPWSARSLSGTPTLRGVLLPGVDGAIAQVAAFDPDLWPTLEPALRGAAHAKGIGVLCTTEAELLRSPCGASHGHR